MFLKAIDRTVSSALVALTSVMVAVGATQVVSRYLFNNPLTWSEELMRYIFVWIVFLGTALGMRRKMHLRVSFLFDSLPPKVRFRLGQVNYCLVMLLMLVLVYESAILTWHVRDQLSPALRIPMSIPYSGMTVGSILILIYAVAEFVEDFRKGSGA